MHSLRRRTGRAWASGRALWWSVEVGEPRVQSVRPTSAKEAIKSLRRCSTHNRELSTEARHAAHAFPFSSNYHHHSWCLLVSFSTFQSTMRPWEGTLRARNLFEFHSNLHQGDIRALQRVGSENI